jgi:succinate dehydrogenase hydrophobic anchor subunit
VSHGPAKFALIDGVILVVLVMALTIFACIQIEPPEQDVAEKQETSAKHCCDGGSRIGCDASRPTLEAASLCLVLLAFALGLVAILRLANDGNLIPLIIPDEE